MYAYYLLYVVCLLASGYLLYRFPKGTFLLWLNRKHGSFQDTFFKYYTNLGETYSYVILLVVGYFYPWFPWWSVIVLLLLESGIVHFFKKIVLRGEYRPKRYFRSIVKLNFVEGVKVHRINSFPSGHTATAFAITNFLNLYLRDTIIGMALFFVAVLIGISRIYLCQHFLRDVFAGSMVGIVSSILVYQMIQYLA
jgi:membrane-associated phospholipid phosphatase